jgi:hypothetical protein
MNKSIDCLLLWNGSGWTRGISWQDNNRRDSQLILKFDTLASSDYRRIYNTLPPIFDVVKYLEIPLSHILVTITTRRATLLRPYVSLLSETITVTPEYMYIGQNKIRINHMTMIFADSRDYIQFH